MKAKKLISHVQNTLRPYVLSLAGLVSVCVFPLLLLNSFSVKIINTKPAAVVFLLLDLLLIFFFLPGKDINVMLLVLFVAWMGFASMHEGASAIKAFGGSVSRFWFVCIFIFFTGYLLRGEKRKKWLWTMLTVYVLSVNISFVCVFVRALRNLFDPSVLTDLTYGEFRNGRLHGLNNANTLGAAAALALVACAWACVTFIRGRKALAVVALFDLLIVGLSRSRGSILSLAAGTAIVVFCTFTGKTEKCKPEKCKPEKCKPENLHARRVVAAICIAAVTAALFAVIPVLIKKPFDACVKAYAKRTVSAEEYERISKVLVPYGMDYAIDTLTDRTLIWPATVKMFAENPLRWLFGYTANDSINVHINYIYPGRPDLWAVYAHNGPLQYLITYGVPGSLILLAITVLWAAGGLKVLFGRNLGKADGLRQTEMQTEQSGTAAGQTGMQAKQNITPVVAFGFVPLMLSVIEVHPFPFWALTFPSFLFFFAAGICESSLAEQRTDTKKSGITAVILNVLTLIFIASAVIIGLGRTLQSHRNAAAQGTVTTQTEARKLYDASVPENLKMASGWIKELQKQGHDMSKVLMTEQEINAFNEANRKFLHVYNIDLDIRDIGTVFNGEVLRNAIFETYDASEEEKKALNLDAIGATVDTFLAVCTVRTPIYKFPAETDTEAGALNPEDGNLIISTLEPSEPLVLLHETADSKWVYCFVYGFGGWIKNENLSVVPDKETWLGYFEHTDVKPFTEENLIISVFEHLGRPYGNGSAECYTVGTGEQDVFLDGTGEMIYSTDCSGFVREIYSEFGINLPRTSAAQADVAGVKTDSFFPLASMQRKCFETLPAGALLYFPGHIMLYLGTVDGVPYCISAVDEVLSRDSAGTLRITIGEVSVTNMDYTLRASRKTWFDSVEKVVVFGDIR